MRHGDWFDQINEDVSNLKETVGRLSVRITDLEKANGTCELKTTKEVLDCIDHLTQAIEDGNNNEAAGCLQALLSFCGAGPFQKNQIIQKLIQSHII